MAQDVSDSENGVLGKSLAGFPLATPAVRKRGSRALASLADTAGRSAESATFVALLLESAAGVADRHSVSDAIPAEERELWRSVGASFEDPAAPACSEARSAAAFAELLTRSEVGDAAASARLGVDRTRISQRVAERSLYAVPGGDERYYPRWQFAGAKVLRGLKAVLAVLDPGLHPLTVDHWFSTPNLDLAIDGSAVSPAVWLATGGDIAATVQLAGDL